MADICDDMKGEDAEAVAAAARASSERDEIALAVLLRMATCWSDAGRRGLTSERYGGIAYSIADAFLAERARRRAEGGA